MATTPQEEEREARKRYREGQRLARLSAQAREREARQARSAARQAATKLRGEQRSASSAYGRAVRAATRERRGETPESIDELFDVADRQMGVVLSMGRRLRQLELEGSA